MYIALLLKLFQPAPSAHSLIAVVAAQTELFALIQHAAVFVKPCVDGRLAAAAADGFYFRKVLFLKPSVDTRVGGNIVWSRIGLKAEATLITPAENLEKLYLEKKETANVIIVDECQFLTESQIDQLRSLVNDYNIPVMCFGLRTDFLTHFFPGARRLMELADSITEIKTVCACGRKATVNARIDENGRIITQGDQVFLGGNDSYVAMCHKCWVSRIKEQEK